MPNLRLPLSPVSIAATTVGVLAVAYIGLIAVVMSYAAMTIEFSQSVRNNGALIADLEAKYLATVSEVTSIDYVRAGYVKPETQIFVPTRSTTALR